MPDKKKVLIVQNIHHKGIELLKNRSDFEYEILDSEEMVDKIDPELFKQKIKDCDAMSIRTEKLIKFASFFLGIILSHTHLRYRLVL